MRYAGILENDFVNGQDVCVSLWTQGCHFHCPDCHNPQTWDFDGGIEEDESIVLERIITSITKNNIRRNFSILGGEPLCSENAANILRIIWGVRKAFPDIKIHLWTGYTLEQLKEKNDIVVSNILENIDVLIDGPYIQEKRNITLSLRGSENQRILYKHIDF